MARFRGERALRRGSKAVNEGEHRLAIDMVNGGRNFKSRPP